ncbi:FAD-binding protein [Streptosporangiaceae bacterium NEAU-GS5]|nr:FAD-binding protein [Streptosporangiaceae bacterium NEAU-GS5]
MPTNWAGNITFQTGTTQPETVDELRELVSGRRKVRVIGSGHSFNTIADSADTIVSLDRLPYEMDVSGDQATISGNVRYSTLGPWLHGNGRALRNMASLPHISVAGSVATATHGSGVTNGNLATAVSALELVTADGDLITLDRSDARFAGAVVGLGALGVVVRLTLDVVPAFDVWQYVYEGLSFDTLDFDAVMSSAYSVSLFTDWSDVRAWVKATEPVPDWFGLRPADGPRHPLPGVPAEFCTQQGGVPGPWFERLPHFRPDFMPSAGEELQSEFMIPKAYAPAAIEALRGAGDRIRPALQISEIRTVAPDDLWLSPMFERETVCLHFTWIADTAQVMPVVELVEELLEPYEPRPHWGKVFTRAPRPHPGFASLARELDPKGVFANDFLIRNGLL